MAVAASIDWMMLEPFVFRRDEDSSFPDDSTAPFRAEGISSHGGPFKVALRIVAPPAISRLYLHWPGGPKEGSSSDIVATHHNLILFRLTSNPVKEKDESLIWPQEYFICQGSLHQQTLQVHPIPICTLRSLHPRSVGLLCRPQENFVLAQLRLSESHLPVRMEAELCILRSGKWELLQNLRVIYKADKLSDLIHWRTDRVIPFENKLYWVSYFSGGTLSCDLSKIKPKIHYHQLPIRDRCRRIDLERLHDMNCSLCISDSGSKLMFINVAPEDAEIFGPMLPGTDFVVTCHTWRTEGMKWDLVFSIKSDEIWGFNAYVPRNVFMFPLMSMAKSNELYFLLSEERKCVIEVLVIAVDTITKSAAIHPYVKGEEDLGGEDDDMVWRKSRLLNPCVPSEFPKFLEWEPMLAAKRAALPEEPLQNSEGAVAIVVRMPDGSCQGRHFLKSDQLQVNFDFIDISRAFNPGTYRLVGCYPKRAFTDEECQMSLSDVGITSKQQALFLEQISG